jgi:hypothetical protein
MHLVMFQTVVYHTKEARYHRGGFTSALDAYRPCLLNA